MGKLDLSENPKRRDLPSQTKPLPPLFKSEADLGPPTESVLSKSGKKG